MEANRGENIRPVGFETRAGFEDTDFARVDHVHAIDPELLRIVTPLSNNNIDNPMFYHWQRTLPITGVNQYTFDRWYMGAAGAAVVSSAVSTDAPANVFPSSGLFTVTTVDTSLAAGDYLFIQQGVEGYRIQDSFMGTSQAKGLSLSFWAKSSVAGTYCVSLRDGSATYSYIKEYTLTANTWTFVSMFFPPTALGTWSQTTGRNCIVGWALASGSTFQTTANSWNNVNALATSNQVNWAATLSNTFRLTAVKLEVGPQVTPFRTPDHVEELNKIRRYFCRYIDPPLRGVISGATTAARCGMTFLVPMRAAPVLTVTGTPQIYDGVFGGNVTGVSVSYMDTLSAEHDLAMGGGGFTVGRGATVYKGPNSIWDYSAEI